MKRLAAGLVAFTAAAFAADNAVFGLELGQRLSLPECPKTTGAFPDYRIAHNEFCFERFPTRVGEEGPIINDTIVISLPHDKKPRMVSGNVVGRVLDGRLESVTFNTAGQSVAELVLEDLVQKYGKPTSQEAVPGQTRMGAKFTAVNALWELPGLRVLYASVLDKISTGIVVIQTPKAVQNEQLEKAQRKATEPRL